MKLKLSMLAGIIASIFIMASFVAAFTNAPEQQDRGGGTPEEPTLKKDRHARQVSGEVTAVDAAANTLTVKGKKGNISLTIDDKTSVMVGKEKKSLADVKSGEDVTVKYIDHEGKNTAKSIAVKPAKAKSKASKDIRYRGGGTPEPPIKKSIK